MFIYKENKYSIYKLVFYKYLLTIKLKTEKIYLDRIIKKVSKINKFLLMIRFILKEKI